MTKTPFLFVAFLAGSLLNQSLAVPPGDTVAATHLAPPSTLIINANVTVMLIDDENAVVDVVGKERLIKNVSFRRTGDTLVIDAPLAKSLQFSGTVYVPAGRLRSIRINSEAFLRSFRFLRLPRLDIVVNGACDIALVNTGRVHLTGTENFNVEYSIEERRLPYGPAFANGARKYLAALD